MKIAKVHSHFILIVCLVILNFALQSTAKTVSSNLFINRGEMQMVKVNLKDNTKMPFIAFNTTATFNAVNAHIVLVAGDSLIITLKNNDNIAHGFAIQNTAITNTQVKSQETVVIKAIVNQWGCSIFYDPLDYPKNVYMGLTGTLEIQKTAKSQKAYYWNIKEHSTLFSNQLSNNLAVDWETYYPNYFTCNSLSYPDSKPEVTTSIDGNVGDTVYIYMANTGIADHVVHFHGFHSTIKQTNKNKKYIGYSKDSFPLESMQTMVLELVLDKKGEYPVHDHNLLAVTGKNVHPYGMMLIIKVK